MSTHLFDGSEGRAHGFLLALMLFRSRDFEPLISFLDDSDATPLADRARSIASLDRQVRVDLLVNELKKTLYRSSKSWILAVHPSWLVALLSGEDSDVQRVALASLPVGISQQVGRHFRTDAEEKENHSGPSDAILNVVRRAIEKQFVQMRFMQFETTFSAELLLVLSKDELMRVVQEAGEKEFAFFLRKEDTKIQREVLQRLEYGVAQKIIGYIESDVNGDSDLYSLVVQMAERGMIDERFAKCLRP